MAYKVLIPQDITEAGKLYLTDRGYEIKVLKDSSEEAIIREVGDYDAILARTAVYTRKIFMSAKKLKVISRYGIGTDNFDVPAATELGIQITNAPIANTVSVAEHAMSLILACAKKLIIHDKAQKNGDYGSRDKLHSTELAGKTLGLIGCGHIGRIVARMAALGFNMNVIGYDAYMKQTQLPEYIKLYDDPDTVFKEADFVSLHIPATKDTLNFVDFEKLSMMKDTAILINCARGGVVNEEDLYKALRKHVIAGAGLDVFKQEPPEKDNPLFTLDNVIVSPHNAALSNEATDRMGIHAAQGIDEVLSGKVPTWPVNYLTN